MSRTPAQYFEDLYAGNEDPWGFDTRWYERRKYALTVASLPDERYHSAFEPGCSIGALTALLAPRCDAILAVDHMPQPLEAAHRRLDHLAHVRVERRILPEHWPEGPFDLLVLSEVAYYFDENELRALMERARQSLDANAIVIAVHWSGETNYPLTGPRTHEVLASTAHFQSVVHHVDEQFLLDVWRYAP
jgi:trans-aconitate methyltransferase